MRSPTKPSRVWLVTAVCFGAFALAGCNPPASDADTSAGAHDDHDHDHGHDHDHDHGHRPDSLHEAVEHLEEIQQTIAEAIKSGDAEAAHGPLHEVGELLQLIPDVAAETDLSKEQWEVVKAASDRLFKAYGVIDKAFHVKDGDKQAAYEEVASELSAALAEIETLLPMTGEEVAAHDHADHDDHDHDDHDHDDHDHDDHDHDDHDHDDHDHDHEAEEEASPNEGGTE